VFYSKYSHTSQIWDEAPVAWKSGSKNKKTKKMKNSPTVRCQSNLFTGLWGDLQRHQQFLVYRGIQMWWYVLKVSEGNFNVTGHNQVERSATTEN